MGFMQNTELTYFTMCFVFTLNKSIQFSFKTNFV